MKRHKRLIVHRQAVVNNLTTGKPMIKGNRYKLELPVAPSNVTAPVIAGTGAVGDAITLTPGTWSGDPAPAITLQWFADGVTIAGETGPTYTPVAGDVGKTITLRETATNVAGSAQSMSNGIAVA